MPSEIPKRWATIFDTAFYFLKFESIASDFERNITCIEYLVFHFKPDENRLYPFRSFVIEHRKDSLFAPISL